MADDKKVWDETWDLIQNDNRGHDYFVVFPGDEDNAALLTAQRAKLAAAAPEMARLLIELVYRRGSENDPLRQRAADVLGKAGVLNVQKFVVTL